MIPNPVSNPVLQYALAFVQVRHARVRSGELDRGASAIEWAIITAVLAVIAVAIGKTIYDKVTQKAAEIDTTTSY